MNEKMENNFTCSCGHSLNRHAESGCMAIVDSNPPDKNLGDRDFCLCQRPPQAIVDAILEKVLARHAAAELELYAVGYNRAVRDIKEELKNGKA